MSNIQRLARNDDPSVDSLPVAPDHLQVNEVSSPSVPHKIPERGVGERVTVGYFDREGVDQLRRTLTHFSEAEEPALARILSSESVSVPPTGPFDFERTLRTIMKKRNAAGIQSRELGVMFKDLRVVGLGAAASYQNSFDSFFNPKIILENIRTARNPPVRDILSGFEGVVRPGEMLLVLGNPGSGCSTFLKTLANQRAEYHLVEGEVHYDSLTPEDIAKHYRGDVTYCPEDDIHFPTLTVDETLRFAAKMRAPHTRFEDRTRSFYVKNITDIVQAIFGLRHVKNTPVGDAAIRGVSGGEKKRVSISETLTLRSSINSWDNSTRGLDASTALEFVRALRIGTDVAHFSTIVSIYQAGESLYRHFDKVCVIYEGRMAYFGRADRARQYFIDLGFEPAHRQTTADFLVAVTDPTARIVRDEFKGRTPQTAAEFASTFLASRAAIENRADMDSYRKDFVGKPERVLGYQQSVTAEHATTARKGSSYMISLPMQARAVMLRRLQILRGNFATQLIIVITFITQAIINGTVFFRMKDQTAEYFSRGGILFFSLLWAALSALAEIPALFGQRAIVVKHARAAMYHPFIEAVALTLVDIPITFATMISFSIILYFMTGLQSTAHQFFTFFLFVFTISLVMKAWFRTVAAAFGDPAPAQTVAGIMMLTLVLYTGYTIPKPSMTGALKWISYVNPIRYGFEGLISNEFHTLNGSCSDLIPSGAGYENVSLANQVCGTVGSIAGQSTVDGNRFIELSFNYSHSHLWRNYGIVIGFGILFVCGLLYFTEYNTHIPGEKSITLFKRGARTPIIAEAQEKGSDAERGVVDLRGAIRAEEKPRTIANDSRESISVPMMTDVFTWRHIQYDVNLKKGETRRLLDDISGFVAPGKLTALMGESGAGKTTLLNVLAERQAAGVVRGERLVNGYALPSDFQAQTGYVQQMDTHIAQTTVREALLFSAKLRQPPSVPLEEKEAYVETVLKMCGLEKHADAIVGTLGVEHRKRTTIGVELAAKPRLLLFLDEPTSGLDSQSAWAIVTFLRELANHGQAILCTIHQPSAELFQEFDRLLLLRKGGQTVYFGDIGTNATTLIDYFQNNGGSPCAPDANPAEYILDVIGAGATATTEIDWDSVWKNSPEARVVDEELETLLQDGRKRHAVDTAQHSEFSTPWVYQTKTLWEREVIRHWRDPTYLMAKLALNLVAGLFIGFTFYKAKDSVQGTQDKIFAVFMSLVMGPPLANQIQGVFYNTRCVYEIRERPSRMYSWSALITAQVLGEIPLNMVGSSLYFLIWYWLVGFDSSRAGYSYLMVGIVYPMYYSSFGMWVAAMAPNPAIAAQLFGFFFGFVVTFNGVLQPYKHLGWWKWMYRVSPYTYVVEGLVGQAVGRHELTCAAIEYVTVTPPSGQTCQDYLSQYINNNGGYVTNPGAVDNCHFCAFRTTDQFLATNSNIFYDHHWRNLGFFCIYVAFNISAIFAMTYIFRIRGPSNLFSRKK
ncbi:ABC-2 type transporter-domain-containing protein [Russula ochroleuca]|jgi:ATP-binding cassette subfamily G (WHITE) protein 2 (SNQ2)|uniref:ABC-2 type transporter-domain-containing protein n=1 Tax=Russula ochroleuca TaxID=152965 RepID=A0A9P5MSH3_9AGAM|nr:ABC-2 type transporter-domain-containing protein [Russula ochroleuca]